MWKQNEAIAGGQTAQDPSYGKSFCNLYKGPNILYNVS